MTAARRTVVVYSHLFPFPPRHGAHQRMLQVLRYFVRRGFDVHLVAHFASWDNKFDPLAVNLPIKIHELKLAGGAVRLDTWWRRIRKSADREFSISVQWAFSRKSRRLAPDLILVNYCSGMRVLPEPTGVPVIVDTHDFLAMSKFLSDRARGHIESGAPVFEPLAEASKSFDRSDDCKIEVGLMSRADLVLGISKAETTTFAKLMSTPVLTYNYHEPDADDRPSQATAPTRALGLMPIGTGDNPHNRLGALVLDEAFRRAGDVPATPLVVGTGRASERLPLGPWFEAAGEVDDYQNFIGQFAYGICPAFWGTGAQIKQYEFAAWGVPVIGYRDTLDPEAWVHDYNSILVATPDELRAAIIDLARRPKRLAALRRGAARLQRTLMERNMLQERELDARVEMLLGARLRR